MPNSKLVTYLVVTLRDAQHICWKNFKKVNDNLEPERGERWTPFVTVTDLLEEAGEVASAVKALEDPRSGEKSGTKETLAKDLSNMLCTIFVLAEHYHIELEETFLQTVNDYILRFIR